jgi:nicotinic acid mononucleotide adenylyltransferase
MKNNTPKIVVYGGAFTPPTIGHHEIVRALLTHLDIDHLLIVPSGPRIDKAYALEKETRRQIIQVFADEFGDDRVEADFTFLDGESDTTTLGMDRHYREQFGESPIQVFGADVTHSMERWPNSPANREYLLRELPKVFLSRAWVDMSLEWKDNYSIINTIIPEVSSTAVREQGRVELLTDRVRETYQRLVLDRASA